jgi:hypothetical protein
MNEYETWRVWLAAGQIVATLLTPLLIIRITKEK